VDPRAGLDDMVKSKIGDPRDLNFEPLSRPVRRITGVGNTVTVAVRVMRVPKMTKEANCRAYELDCRHRDHS
jgi:hypothetical protein